MVKKVKIFDSAFTYLGKSASLREDNADVHPSHFEWYLGKYSNPNPMFFTDGHLSEVERWIHRGKKVAWLLEPRALRPENYEAAEDYEDYFDAILTYDQELLDKFPKIARFYPFGGSSIDFLKWGDFYPKTKEICMFMSDKTELEGHKLRHEIAEHLSNWVDVYRAPFGSKWEILKDYKYCVVVESNKADNYFTEKLIDPISVGTTPIYWGCPNIETFLPVKLIFNTVRTLKTIFSNLSYAEAAGVSYYKVDIPLAREFAICEDYIFENYKDLFE